MGLVLWVVVSHSPRRSIYPVRNRCCARHRPKIPWIIRQRRLWRRRTRHPSSSTTCRRCRARMLLLLLLLLRGGWKTPFWLRRTRTARIHG